MTRASRFIAPVVLGVAALALAVAVVRASLPSLFSSAPQVVLRVAPGDPDASYKIAALTYARKPGRLSDTTYAAMIAAARRAPLSADPFVIIATRALAAGDTSLATRLLEEARRRNPRQRLARALLVDRYIHDGRVREAGVEIAVLDRLVSQANTLLVDALTRLAMEPSAVDATARALRGDEVLDPVLANLIARGASTETILRMAQGWRPNPQAEEAGLWRVRLLQRLVDQGDYGRARQLWLRIGGGDAASPATRLYNGGFALTPALPPFNWRLATDETGAAEITRGHRLSVDYFGRQSGELVGQLLLLAPGRHRLRATLVGSATGQGSQLRWSVRCAVVGRASTGLPALATVVIAKLADSPRVMSADFTVPAGGCPAQWLTLDGVAAEFPTTQSIEVSNMSIDPEGAR